MAVLLHYILPWLLAYDGGITVIAKPVQDSPGTKISLQVTTQGHSSLLAQKRIDDLDDAVYASADTGGGTWQAKADKTRNNKQSEIEGMHQHANEVREWNEAQKVNQEKDGRDAVVRAKAAETIYRRHQEAQMEATAEEIKTEQSQVKSLRQHLDEEQDFLHAWREQHPKSDDHMHASNQLDKYVHAEALKKQGKLAVANMAEKPASRQHDHDSRYGDWLQNSHSAENALRPSEPRNLMRREAEPADTKVMETPSQVQQQVNHVGPKTIAEHHDHVDQTQWWGHHSVLVDFDRAELGVAPHPEDAPKQVPQHVVQASEQDSLQQDHDRDERNRRFDEVKHSSGWDSNSEKIDAGMDGYDADAEDDHGALIHEDEGGSGVQPHDASNEASDDNGRTAMSDASSARYNANAGGTENSTSNDQQAKLGLDKESTGSGGSISSAVGYSEKPTPMLAGASNSAGSKDPGEDSASTSGNSTSSDGISSDDANGDGVENQPTSDDNEETEQAAFVRDPKVDSSGSDTSGINAVDSGSSASGEQADVNKLDQHDMSEQAPPNTQTSTQDESGNSISNGGSPENPDDQQSAIQQTSVNWDTAFRNPSVSLSEAAISEAAKNTASQAGDDETDSTGGSSEPDTAHTHGPEYLQLQRRSTMYRPGNGWGASEAISKLKHGTAKANHRFFDQEGDIQYMEDLRRVGKGRLSQAREAQMTLKNDRGPGEEDSNLPSVDWSGASSEHSASSEPSMTLPNLDLEQSAESLAEPGDV